MEYSPAETKGATDGNGRVPLAGLRTILGQEGMLGTLVRVINSGKQALGSMMLEIERMVAESVVLMER